MNEQLLTEDELRVLLELTRGAVTYRLGSSGFKPTKDKYFYLNEKLANYVKQIEDSYTFYKE